MEEEKYNKIVEEFLEISVKTILIAREVKGDYGRLSKSNSADDMRKREEVKNRLFKVLPEMDLKQLIKLLSQTKDFEVNTEIIKALSNKSKI